MRPLTNRSHGLRRDDDEQLHKTTHFRPSCVVDTAEPGTLPLHCLAPTAPHYPLDRSHSEETLTGQLAGQPDPCRNSRVMQLLAGPDAATIALD